MPTREIRRATPTDAGPLAAVQVDTWRTAYAGIVAQAYLDGLSYAAREARWRNILAPDPGGSGPRGFTHVAEVDGRVVGFVNGGPPRDERVATTRFDGELYAIYILASHQGVGLGGRLVRALASDLAAAGARSMYLWVLAANPACRFYARIGGAVADRRVVSIGGADLEELAFGWSDLTSAVRAWSGPYLDSR